MHIGIFTNLQRDTDLAVTKRCGKLIREFGHTPVTELELPGLEDFEVAPYSSADLVVSLGGDGTFLAMTHLPDVASTPMIGVNLGSVGFLPSIEVPHLAASLKRICDGEFFIEERMRLRYRAVSAAGETLATGIALNDVVVHRGGCRSILTVDLWIDGDEVERVPGDGIIVATPTGSTAYTLSAGGPIVHPKEQGLLVTAICPHTLHNRTYVASANSVIKIKVQKHTKGAVLSDDGRDGILLHKDDYLEVWKAQHPLKMIQLGRDNFYETLAEKIQKRGISK